MHPGLLCFQVDWYKEHFSTAFKTAFEAKLMPVLKCRELVDALNSQSHEFYFCTLYIKFYQELKVFPFCMPSSTVISEELSI